MKLEPDSYYDIDAATGSVVTGGWIVSELCSKHDEQSLKFLPVIVWSDRQTDRQPLFKHDELKSCAACGVVRKY